ncbi:MAG: helix-turn-helix transcriptional regulator [Lachnospiraceae bacterium]|nr:helix-turn-helix transcriptional regulator [Lachnospiraceae bacterium]
MAYSTRNSLSASLIRSYFLTSIGQTRFMGVTTNTLDTLCFILNCSVSDILLYKPE